VEAPKIKLRGLSCFSSGFFSSTYSCGFFSEGVGTPNKPPVDGAKAGILFSPVNRKALGFFSPNKEPS